jgi:hypothetical protein
MGIWTPADLYKNVRLRDFQFWKSKGISNSKYMLWRGLISAIPPETKRQIREGLNNDDKCSLDLSQHKSIEKAKSRDFYNLFLKQHYLKPTAHKHYPNEYTEKQWKEIYCLPRTVSIDTKSREFQYRCLHRIIPTNTFLYKIGKAETNACSFCLIPKAHFVEMKRKLSNTYSFAVKSYKYFGMTLCKVTL